MSLESIQLGQSDTLRLKDLSQVLTALNLTAQEDQKRALLDYADLILKWNKTYNLTALNKPEEIWVQHIFDSLSVVAPLNHFIREHNISNPIVYDVGSGAGLPGVVLSVMCPHIKVTCVDAVGKKVAFIKYAAGALRLKNLNAVHQRIEAWQVQPAHIVISRAFTSLANFVTWAGQHVQLGGCLVAMKAHLSDQELTEFATQASWQINRVQRLDVPRLDATRCLVWINKKQD